MKTVHLSDLPGTDVNTKLHVEYMTSYFETAHMASQEPHVHSFYEIMWFWDAGGVHSIDFNDIEVGPDTLIFLAPGQLHHYITRPDAQGVLILFADDFFEKSRAMDDIFMKYDMFNSYGSSPCYTVDEFTAANLRLLVEMMLQEIEMADQFGHADMMRAMLRLFITNVRRSGVRQEHTHLQPRNTNHRLYIEFRQMVERDYGQKHMVRDYAERLNVSVKTLTNAVSECTGTTPLHLINSRLTLESKRLLLYSDLPLKEVASRMGFDDPSYFAKFFKREANCLPSQFRANV